MSNHEKQVKIPLFLKEFNDSKSFDHIWFVIRLIWVFRIFNLQRSKQDRSSFVWQT